MGSVRRLMSAVITATLVAPALPLLGAVSGCSGSDPFVTHHCALDDSPRVSAQRVVTLLAINYIYAEHDEQNYISSAMHAMPAIYDEANKIFRDNGINLRILLWTSVDAGDVRGMTAFTYPNVPAIKADLDKHDKQRKLIGVFWSQWEGAPGYYTAGYDAHTTTCLPSQECNYVNLYGWITNHGSDLKLVGRSLAAAFGYYFNLIDVTDPANLMHSSNDPAQPGPTGTLLTPEQRSIMWAAINTGRTGLLSETCDPPIQLAPLPKITG